MSLWHAAAAFTIGAIFPKLAILPPPPEWRIPVTFAWIGLVAAVADQCELRGSNFFTSLTGRRPQSALDPESLDGD